VLRGVGNPRTLIRIGGTGQRRPGRDVLPVSDVYVPVGARSFTLERLGSLKVGDDITVYRPKSQRWICAIGADVMPAQTDGKANPPWRAMGAHTFERRITKIEGHRITVDVPLTNALEKEFTQAYVTQTEFADRASEIGVENLAAWGDFVSTGRCPPPRGRLIRADVLVNGWVRNVRSENLGGELASLGSGSKWMTVEDATYVVDDLDKCAGQTAFNLGGQQNLFLRLRSVGSHVNALITETEMEGPNAVVDLLAVGRNVRVRVASRWSTGFLFDNVRIQDESGMPSGDIDLSRGRATFGWSAANSVVWNSDAEVLSVDSPPTANNWVMGGARGAKTLTGTGHFAAPRALLHPQSLYRAQLVERLGRSALNAVGRSALGTLPGPITGIGAEAAGSGIGVGLGNAGAGGAGAPGTTQPGGLR
jgi:hypothetical protein